MTASFSLICPIFLLLFLPLDAGLIFDVYADAAIVGGEFIATLPILPKVHSPLPTEYYSVVLVVIFSKERGLE
jgi:hypothetical protein